MYHVNDSGDSGRFFVTDMQGGNTQTVNITGFKPRDVEGLSLGPCGGGATCIFVADIGDNGRDRAATEIVVIEETEALPQSVVPKKRIALRYPSGSYDAESFAVHPDGTIFVLTKSTNPRLFKLPPRAWQSGKETVHVLEPVRALRTGSPPTDMSISDDGARFLVLTYIGAVEFDAQFTPRDIPLRFLLQQEGVAYLPGSRSFVYTSERRGGTAWIMRSNWVPCKNGDVARIFREPRFWRRSENWAMSPFLFPGRLQKNGDIAQFLQARR
jgi:hypothetical protein